ncbi:hypothetical protein SAMN05421867_109121 [Cellulomonas marina]|uniref:Uncharacterized protein n=1 Tax=Cellulomonas marina TaxID=988821 RepID=A0A1I0Z340_9CELL|nr:hypothetical protein SAMN05421867_109121 [Cellulomonas marina]
MSGTAGGSLSPTVGLIGVMVVVVIAAVLYARRNRR